MTEHYGDYRDVEALKARVAHLGSERDRVDLLHDAAIHRVQDRAGKAEAERDRLRAALDDGCTEEQKYEALEKIQARDDFLAHEGYRRCDIPACNCGSWHKTSN